MNHWEELAEDFGQAIADGLNERAAEILAEFALAAPASSVRRHHGYLVEASARCTDEQVRDHFLSVLELVRQRASMTRSSLVLLTPQKFDRTRVDVRLSIKGGEMMATTTQANAARRNVKKAQQAAKRKRTIAHLPASTRRELGRQAARGRRRGGQPGRALEERNRQQLYELAKEKEIPGRSKMGKWDLISAIRRVR